MLEVGVEVEEKEGWDMVGGEWRLGGKEGEGGEGSGVSFELLGENASFPAGILGDFLRARR